jgi:predicted nuclease of predicted toxin-antitoxin system
MKFLVDAQLPRRFCAWLAAEGHDAVHTLDLPQRNRTTDREILDLAEHEDRIVVTKDDDFVQSFFLAGRPPKLLFVATGNISNVGLESLIRNNLPMITKAFEAHRFIEIGNESLVIHE